MLIKIFASFLLLLGLVSIISGIYMIPTNGMGMPLSWLENTIFGSYLVPGLILAIVIGGFSFSAGILLLLKRRCAIEVTVSTGFALLIWIFTEIYLIRESHWLQAAFFIVGAAILIASMFIIKFSKK
jgi:hypothetical protein